MGIGATVLAASAFWMRRLPTWGPLPCVSTTCQPLSTSSAMRRMAPSTLKSCSSKVPTCPGCRMAVPPRATTTVLRVFLRVSAISFLTRCRSEWPPWSLPLTLRCLGEQGLADGLQVGVRGQLVDADQRQHEGLLEVHTVLRLREDDRGVAVGDVVGDLLATHGRQAVHEPGAGLRVAPELLVDLERLEGGDAILVLVFLAGPPPAVGVDEVGAGDGLQRVVGEQERAAALGGEPGGQLGQLGGHLVARGVADAHVETQLGERGREGVAGVGGVPDVGERDAGHPCNSLSTTLTK